MAKKAKKARLAAKRMEPKASNVFDSVYKPKIKVVGVGGGGSNIVAEIAKLVGRLDFVAANTDEQALAHIARKNVKTFAFGEKLTQGLGCGMDAVLAQEAAQQDKEKVLKLLEGQDLLVLVSSLGGGAGSGAAPVFLQTAKELKCLTIGIFTMPFSFEGEKRQQLALSSLEKLKPLVNTYMLIPNDNIFGIIEKNTAFHNALSALNKKLAESLQGFIEILSLAGFINIDFADIQSLLEGRDKLSYLASAIASGQDRASVALEQVLVNPLLAYSSKGAERVLLNISGGKDLKMSEVVEVSRAISRESPKAKVIFGITLGNVFEKKMRITLFALGVQKEVSAPPPSLKLPRAGRKQKRLPLRGKVLVQEKPLSSVPLAQPRRNALELHKAIEEEIEELEEKEKAWDIPAFLRAKRA